MVSLWEKENSKDIQTKLILFLISPFISLLYSIRNINRKSSFWVIFGFCVTFGLAYTVGTERYESSGDGISYRVIFEQYRNVPTAEFLFDLKEYLQFNEGALDFYADTVSFLVSRFTGNYHVLFMVYAIVFAFFQLKSLRFFVLSNKQNTMTFYVLCLFIMFTFNQIFNINGVRFWTAAWIAVYSILRIFYDNKRGYLLLLAFTPFVHGSYFILFFVSVLALLTKRFKKIWTALFILSFVFATIAVDVFNFSLDYLPSFIANQAETYFDESNIAEINNRVGTGFWLVGKAFSSIEKIYISLMIVLLVINKKSIIDKGTDDLLGALLVMASFANFSMPIPSVGIRFFRLLFPLIAILFLKYMPENKYRYFVWAFPFVFVFPLYYLILNYMTVVEPVFFITSPIIVFIKNLIII